MANKALRIDQEMNTSFWMKAIKKERKKVKAAWEAREDITTEKA